LLSPSPSPSVGIIVGDKDTGADDGGKVTLNLVGLNVGNVVTFMDGELEASADGSVVGDNDMLGRAVGAIVGFVEIVGAGV
jgi:hypothetical protein